MTNMVTPEQQFSHGPQRVADSSFDAGTCRIQRNIAAVATYGFGYSDYIAEVDSLVAVKSGVAGEAQRAGAAVVLDEPVKNQAVVFAIEQYGARSELARFQRTNKHLFAAANRRRHAGAVRLESHGSVLPQEIENDFGIGWCAHGAVVSLGHDEFC